MKSLSPHTQVALITGSAKRIGAHIVRHLHAKGFCVVIHYLHSEKAAYSLAQNLNNLETNSALVIKGDLAHSQMPSDLVSEIIGWKGRLDLLINNASLFISDDHINEEAWQLLFKVNVQAPYFLSQAAFPHLSLHQGSIINITDIHAQKPLKNYGVYCQTKAALTIQSKALARDFAPTVRVNVIAPGAIAWPENNNKLTAQLKAEIIRKTPLQKHGNPENIASGVSYLLENDFITGQVLNVDGGRSLV